MIEIKTKVVLADIEGTTTSINFVKEVLFPYAQQHTLAYLKDNWNDVQRIVDDLIALPQYDEYKLIYPSSLEERNVERVAKFVNYLIDKDLKLAPLKTLQGLVWAKGYADKTLKGHVYSDVARAFKRWRDEDNIRIAIYSSGSVKAQQLLFASTEDGNLLPFICAHFDTSTGYKREMQSYVNIAQALAVDCEDILFLTDIVEEAEAARLAGMETVILNRLGNAPLTDDQKADFRIVNDFDALKLSAK